MNLFLKTYATAKPLTTVTVTKPTPTPVQSTSSQGAPPTPSTKPTKPAQGQHHITHLIADAIITKTSPGSARKSRTETPAVTSAANGDKTSSTPNGPKASGRIEIVYYTQYPL